MARECHWSFLFPRMAPPLPAVSPEETDAEDAPFGCKGRNETSPEATPTALPATRHAKKPAQKGMKRPAAADSGEPKEPAQKGMKRPAAADSGEPKEPVQKGMKRPAAADSGEPLTKMPAAAALKIPVKAPKPIKGSGVKVNSDTQFSGTLLGRFLLAAWGKLSPALQKAVAANLVDKKTTSLASMCSGSGTAEMVHHCFTTFLGKTTDLKFSCESVPWKRAHLGNVLDDVLDCRKACLFREFGELDRGMAVCDAHSNDCEVSFEAFLAVAGWSCKGLSKKIALAKQDQEQVLVTRKGSSGETCQYVLDYIGLSSTPIVVLENVEEMGKPEAFSENVRYLAESVRERGYAIATKVMWANEFFLPQRRQRAWSVLIHVGTFGLTMKEGDAGRFPRARFCGKFRPLVSYEVRIGGAAGSRRSPQGPLEHFACRTLGGPLVATLTLTRVVLESQFLV